MSAQNIQTAATVAAAVASALATQTPGVAMTAGQAAATLGQAIVAAGPLIDPKVGAAVSLATLVLSAVHIATDAGTGLTAEQLKGFIAADDAEVAADIAAEAQMKAAQHV